MSNNKAPLTNADIFGEDVIVEDGLDFQYGDYDDAKWLKVLSTRYTVDGEKCYMFMESNHCGHGAYCDSFEEVVAYAHELAHIPWGEKPHQPPCIEGLDCAMFWTIENVPVIEFSREGYVWNQAILDAYERLKPDVLKLLREEDENERSNKC